MTWITGEMTALAMTAPRTVEARAWPMPPAGPGEVLVRPAFVGICGTDLSLYRGRSVYLDEGSAAYPLVFGHEWSGTVVATSDDATGFAAGDRVIGQTMLSCHACSECRRGRRDLCLVRADMGLFGHDGAAAAYVGVPAAALVPVPDELSLRDAALVEPSVTVVHAFARVRCAYDDRVLVIGTGTLALVAVQLARHLAAEVDVADRRPDIEALALEAGAGRALAPEEVPADRYTVVIEASGAPESLALAVHALRPGGRAALIGVVDGEAPGFSPLHVTHKALELHGILHGIDFYERALGLFARGWIDPELLIDRVLPAAEVGEAFERLAERRMERPKLLLDLAALG